MDPTKVVDYLLQAESFEAAAADMNPWIVAGEGGFWLKRMPVWCDVLGIPEGPDSIRLYAYSKTGVAPTFDDEGNITDPGSPPVHADGVWLLLTIPAAIPVPENVLPYVVASGAREDGLVLPSGVVELSTSLAGMTVK